MAGYRFQQQLAATPDGELWLAAHEHSGELRGVALLTRDVLADPGAPWRIGQELRHLRPEITGEMLVAGPPVPVSGVSNMLQGGPVDRASGYRISKEKRRKEWRMIAVAIGIVLLMCVLGAVVYAGLLGAMFWPAIKNAQVDQQVQKAKGTASDLTVAANAWADAGGHPEGTPYTWQDISDYAPAYLLENATPSGPVDAKGNPYVLNPIGTDVEVNPSTIADLESERMEEIFTR